LIHHCPLLKLEPFNAYTDMDTYLEKVHNQLSDQALAVDTYAGELHITVRVGELHNIIRLLKEDFGFNYLVDISSVDHYRDEQRFEVSYNLFNLDHKKRVRIKTFVEEQSPVVDSICDIHPSANWNEREVWDMMGVRFNNHPDHRRMFMPEDFETAS
jgi:NADH:ubiquinone oxidoreductase 27 kD subunit